MEEPNILDKDSNSSVAILMLGTIVAVDNRLPEAIILYYQDGRHVTLAAQGNEIAAHEAGVKES
jgi:hypothetical protein